MTSKLESNVSFITDKSHENVKETHQLLPEDRIKIAIVDMNKKSLKKTKAALKTEGFEVISVKTDVLKPHVLEVLLEDVVQRFGPIDIFINNTNG